MALHRADPNKMLMYPPYMASPIIASADAQQPPPWRLMVATSLGTNLVVLAEPAGTVQDLKSEPSNFKTLWRGSMISSHESCFHGIVPSKGIRQMARTCCTS